MIRLAKSIVGEDEIKAVSSVMRRGYLGMGQEVQAFESDLRNHFAAVPVFTQAT